MTVQQHDRGEEYTIKTETGQISPASDITVGLFNDSTDNLSDSDDIGAINTEPNDGNYTRKTFTFGTSDISVSKDTSGNFRYTVKDFIIDVVGTTGVVDSFFVLISFNGQGDSSQTQHLVYTGALDQQRDLSNIDKIRLKNVGRTQN